MRKRGRRKGKNLLYNQLHWYSLGKSFDTTNWVVKYEGKQRCSGCEFYIFFSLPIILAKIMQKEALSHFSARRKSPEKMTEDFTILWRRCSTMQEIYSVCGHLPYVDSLSWCGVGRGIIVSMGQVSHLSSCRHYYCQHNHVYTVL